MSLFQRARASLARLFQSVKKTEPAAPVMPAPDAGNPPLQLTNAERYRLRQRRISPNFMAKILAVTAHYKPRLPRKRRQWDKPHQGARECARRVRQMREGKCIDPVAMADWWDAQYASRVGARR